MTTTTFTGRLGLTVRTIEIYEENRAELAKKIKVDEWIDELQAGVDRVAALDARQEAHMAEGRATTIELNAADRNLYRRTSGAIDAAVGVLGKGLPAAEQLARVRSKLHRPGVDTPVEPVEAHQA